jgi:hypothetical protein
MRKLVSLFLLLAAVSGVAFAQGLTGQISGNVQDATGSAIVGAQVQLRNINTNAVREVTTGSSGDFLFTQLLPGVFEITVNAKGFKKFVQPQVQLTATERVVIPALRLELGALTEVVTVEAEAARLQT